MNERIKELAAIARGQMAVLTTVDDEQWRQHEEFVEKFAELIVRECVRYFNEDYERDFDTLWREDLSKGIKEHFGVEE